MKQSKIFKITFCSIMASLSIVLTFFEVNLPIFNLALYALPLVLVSIMFGPGYGLLTGFIAGFVEQLTKGLSIQTFIWILAPIFWGGLSGGVYHLLAHIFKDDKKYKKIIYIAFGIFFSILFANLSNSVAMAVFSYTADPVTSFSTFIVYAVGRMGSIPVHIIIYTPICYIVIKNLKQFIER